MVKLVHHVPEGFGELFVLLAELLTASLRVLCVSADSGIVQIKVRSDFIHDLFASGSLRGKMQLAVDVFAAHMVNKIVCAMIQAKKLPELVRVGIAPKAKQTFGEVIAKWVFHG